MAPVDSQVVTLDEAQRLESGGRYSEAQDAYARLGRFEEAARVALRQDRQQAAAELYAAAGQDLAAARCYLAAGDSARYLEHLIRTPPSDAGYGQVVLAAIHAALQLQTVPFRLMNFLEPFLATNQRDGREQDALYRLGELCEQQGLEEESRQLLEAIVAQDPSFADAAARLASRSAQPAAALPDLPALPSLPSLPAAAPEERAATEDPERARTRTPAPLAAAEVDLSDERSETVTPLPSSHPSMPAQSQAGYDLGSTLDDRYVLQEEIGRGGMAVVYQAFDLELGESIALKVFTAGDTEDMLSRFREELRLSRRLRHENVIQLYDIGVHAGHRYISMELLLGHPLTARIGEKADRLEGLDLLIQACAGLGAVHALGAVHRDIKPDNMFVTNDGVVKVMDFGIAKVAAVDRQTQVGTILGTPQYMAPEQFKGESEVTPATDLYALGVVAYELFTGTLPFEHTELLPLLMLHVNEPPEPPARRNPDIPPELEEVILKLLAKAPEDRFESSAALAASLETIRSSLTE